MLNMRLKKAKTRYGNRATKSKKLLLKMKNNITIKNIKQHNTLMMSVLEADDILLVCRNALRYLLVGVILLCLYASW